MNKNNRHYQQGRRQGGGIGLVVVLLLLVIGGIIGFGWYWFNKPVSGEVLTAENALADENLLLIGHVDVERLLTLNRYWFGELDSDAIPIANDQQQHVLKALFSGSAAFSDNLKQAIFAVQVAAEQPQVMSTLVLVGQFKQEAIIDALKDNYELTDLGEQGWALKPIAELNAKQTAKLVCPDDQKQTSQDRVLYLQTSLDLLVVSDNQARAATIMERYRAEATAGQDLTAWRQYRSGQLISAMIFVPGQAWKMVGGMPGMMAKQAATKTPQLEQIGVRLGVDLMAGGLKLNIKLGSSDQSWNQEQAGKIRAGLDEIKGDSRSVTPSLSNLLSRITVADQSDALDINVSIDSGTLNELEQIVEEGFASLFSMKMTGGSQTSKEQIDKNPKQYTANAALASLPALIIKDHESTPLFHKGAFAADLKSIKRTDEGLLDLWLEGKVALPKSENFGRDRILDLSFSIQSVQDADGKELMRDERCLKGGAVAFGRNHEPATNTMPGVDLASIWKHVRLKQGTALTDINLVKGKLSFFAPITVTKHNVPLKAGESIETQGMRFYLNSVKDNSVSYQLSGDKTPFLELRALNKDGKPLRKSWRMGDPDGGRATQSFQGHIESLQVYIAEKSNHKEIDFTLRDILSVSAKKDKPDNRPITFAPKAMNPRVWKSYAKLKLKRLKIDPKDWHVWGKNKASIGSMTKAPIILHFTHTPKAWGNNPFAHLYFPMLPELPGVLSALSYRIEEPSAKKDSAKEQYIHISYPYYSNSGKIAVKHRIGKNTFALRGFALQTGLKDNQKVKRLKGKLRFRLPTKTRATRFKLDELWSGKTVDGITVTLSSVDRGMFPGYSIKIEGAIDKLVNLHGLEAGGKRVAAHPVNFQQSGYWTMTLPFKGIAEVELVTAIKQASFVYPFNVLPKYSN